MIRTGMPSLTLPLNGDPKNPEILDRFAFEVHQRFRALWSCWRHGDPVTKTGRGVRGASGGRRA